MAAEELAEIAPVDYEDDGAVRGAIFDVRFFGRIIVWPEVVEVNDLLMSFDANPEDLEDAARHLMAAAAWMREANRDG